MNDYKGELTTIYNNPIVQGYINGGTVCGYLGHEFRTTETDKVINNVIEFINILKGETSLNEELVAEWVCSKSARHFMDEHDNKMSRFKEDIVDSLVSMQRYLNMY